MFPTPQGSDLNSALGLTLKGFPGSTVRPMLLTAMFFAGPLLANPAVRRALRSTAVAAVGVVQRLWSSLL